MDKNELLLLLKKNKLKPPEWINSLQPRKIEEILFHNLDREKEDNIVISKQNELDLHANKKFYSITNPSTNYIENWLSLNTKGKIFLDYACGDGFNAIKAVKYGADLSIGIDISDVSVLNAEKIAEKNKIGDKCIFIQADCENTELPNNSVDVIICSGMLHHLDLSYALPELRRILKPGGKILCIEALSVNPLIQFYRNLTPELRTDWEKKHILGPKDLNFSKYFFNVLDIRYWHFFVLCAVPIRNTFLFTPIFTFLNLLDLLLLKLPFVNRLAWQFTFVLEKPKN